ncbi:carboxy methyl transferase for protein phosphatase 2A [Maudiozyma exigua]|uniref:Leucine carboxyl methyltransferase 1 n=1 Tax=Maudiozyma exigua TaxID=34358 RepID=A0A9P6WFY7_MAUEX|nr:carboxy methyl transferase for protein phosphatase 2A [Kazachstania exigua]
MERIIQQTDSDAFASKLCAINYKYLPPTPCAITGTIDDDLQSLYQNIATLHIDYYHNLKEENRNVYGKINKLMRNPFPVMNYGTYLRTMAIDSSIINYINNELPLKETKFQIVNFGSGSDLRFIQYLEKFNKRISKFIDLDFKDAINLKKKILSKSNLLNQLVTKYNDQFIMLEGDLKDITTTMKQLVQNLDLTIPTIFITECVLCYMTQIDSQNLITKIMNNFQKGVWVSYDPIGGSNPNDKFGIIMKRNLLESRNLDMPTLLIYNSKSNYPDRWNLDNNNNSASIDIRDMWDFVSQSITDKEQKRLRSLQFLDEIEELKIMQSHYVILNTAWNI